jgi:hypothetical protein
MAYDEKNEADSSQETLFCLLRMVFRMSDSRSSRRRTLLHDLPHHCGPCDLSNTSLAPCRSRVRDSDDTNGCLEHVVHLLQRRSFDPQAVGDEMLLSRDEQINAEREREREREKDER